MALIFPRLAQNFIKNGYFPTDEVTLERILSALDAQGAVRIFDPCCGEGVALAEVAHALGQDGSEVTAFGVELDAERAWHAKKILNVVLHSDIQDVTFTPRSMGFMFLNPPYGNTVSDKAQLGERSKADRLEKQFFRHMLGALAWGGVMVLIVPHYVLDQEFAQLIGRNYERVQCFMAPETRFKQAVIFGVRKRSDRPDPALVQRLMAFGRGEVQDVLPEYWPGEPYTIPELRRTEKFHYHSVRMDAPQLVDELHTLGSHRTLWNVFETHFAQHDQTHRRPLAPMRPWHLALALAAGQLSGLVQGPQGQQILIKGDTFKGRATHEDLTTHDDGSITRTITSTDRFVPIIRGIDFTPGPNLGAIITIQ